VTDKAGIWLRVSTTDQTEEAQYPDCSAYGERKGYEVSSECVYQVHGASARKGNKRFDVAWSRVIDDIKHGKINVLIVWRLSRLDRKREAFKMIEEARDYGGRIEFAMQPHLNDLSTMAGRIALTVEEEIAYAESEEKSQRATASIAHRKTQGKNTGRYPWGLTSVNGELFPTEEGEKWVAFAFEQIISGRAPGEVAAMFRADGIMPKCHTLFIQRMITREKYRGLIVDPATWDAANDKLNAKPRRGRAPKTGERPLLTPKCASCGGPRYPHAYRDSRNRFYRCYGYQDNGERGCGAPLVNMAEANRRVADMLIDDSPHTEWQYVPGDDIDRRVREVRDQGAAAMRRGDYKAAMGLMAEAEALEASPRREAGWREVETGQTRKQWWDAASNDDRRTYLARYPVTLGKREDGIITVRIGLAKRL
jgi:putative DNA-invertase from lambdoid prophage Rac